MNFENWLLAFVAPALPLSLVMLEVNRRHMRRSWATQITALGGAARRALKAFELHWLLLPISAAVLEALSMLLSEDTFFDALRGTPDLQMMSVAVWLLVMALIYVGVFVVTVATVGFIVDAMKHGESAQRRAGQTA